MSERVPCESCKRPMSGAAARCPHCGALQARAPLGKAAPAPKHAPEQRARAPLRDLTADEARALIAVRDAIDGREPAQEPFNILAWMFAPDHRSQGGARAAEIVLTAVALPLLIGGMAGAGLVVLRRARLRGGPRAVASTVVVMGAIVVGAIVFAQSGSWGAAAGTSIGGLLALAAREWIRGRSAARYAPPDLGA